MYVFNSDMVGTVTPFVLFGRVPWYGTRIFLFFPDGLLF